MGFEWINLLIRMSIFPAMENELRRVTPLLLNIKIISDELFHKTKLWLEISVIWMKQ